MKDITFVDLEVTLNTCRVVDIGAVRSDRTPFHENSFDNLLLFLHQVPYIGGHNILKHDLSYLKPQFEKAGCRQPKIIDTLYLSSLLFPEKLHHQLSKDDKLQADKPNNPVNDSLKSLLLFEEEQNAFERLDSMLKMIYYGLLHDTDEFGGFFDYIDYAPDILDDLSGSILERFSKDICISSPLAELITSYPVELAYGLSLINCWNSSSGIPLWVLHNYPKVGWVMERLRDTPCENNECAYCRGAFNGKEGLKYFFKYDSFRTYEGEDLQQKAVEAAIEGESLLAVFPTGGGKSITFQLPALMSGKRIKGLTVVISPLQSLMKDQVDNLWKNEIMDVVTINGMLDPVERAHAIQRVEEGSVSILYISPESLRSKTIERLLVGRKVVRFVIDEAHCFSAWGQDFRVDYLYIGDFIRLLQEQKGGKQAIPVSCFTATAKQNVIQDIKDYFFEKLNIRFKTFCSGSTRKNLKYKVFKVENEDEKYGLLRSIIEDHDCPAIVYVSRTRTAAKVAMRLQQDGFSAGTFHGKMETRMKTSSQNDFIDNKIRIMVATSAFGMGVDKKNVGLVVHYEISDSLENYVQEAGRAGRDDMKILETERLLLRGLEQGDFKDVCKLLQDDEVMYAYEGAFNDQEVQNWLDRQFGRYRHDGFGLWGVVEKGSNELIGQCGITYQEFDGKRVPEIGYLFKKEFWHKGFAIEAAVACREYAFHTLGFEEVYSIIRDTNIASQKVARRNGMQKVATFIKHYRGVDMPHFVYKVSLCK